MGMSEQDHARHLYRYKGTAGPEDDHRLCSPAYLHDPQAERDAALGAKVREALTNWDCHDAVVARELSLESPEVEAIMDAIADALEAEGYKTSVLVAQKVGNVPRDDKPLGAGDKYRGNVTGGNNAYRDS